MFDSLSSIVSSIVNNPFVQLFGLLGFSFWAIISHFWQKGKNKNVSETLPDYPSSESSPMPQPAEESLLESEGEFFKVAAGIDLQKRLKSLRRIDDETREIDENFISCAEYQLFLDDAQTKGKFYQPDHWAAYRFAKGFAKQPVVGMRARDAEAFCEWLNNKLKNEVKYRLPTLAEAQKFPPQVNGLATWCKGSGDKWDLHWKSPQEHQQIKSKWKELFKGNWKMRYVDEMRHVYTSDCSDPDGFNRARLGAAAMGCTVLLAFLVAFLFTFAVAIAVTRAFADAIAVGFAGALFLSIIFAISRFIVFTYAFDRALIHTFAIADTFQDGKIKYAIKGQHTTFAQQFLQELQPTTVVEQRKKTLLTELLIIITTSNLSEQRQAWQRYIDDLTEYTVIVYDTLEEMEGGRTWWQRLLLRWHKIGNYIYFSLLKYPLLRAWIDITNARQEGKLPVWEGIRIVRDSGSKSSA